MKKKIKVMIADDHTVIREGIRSLLACDQDIQVIAEAKDGEEALQKIVNSRPDIILLDVNMPHKDGFDVLVKIRDNNYDVKVILFTMHYEVEVLVKAIEIGIRGYVLKDSSKETIVNAIKMINKGEVFIEPSMVKYLFEEFDPKEYKHKNRVKLVPNNVFDLTIRELEVLKLITEGMFNKEIAGNLSISEKTVKNHVSNILRKMNVYDRTQAAVSALRQNIISV